MRVRSLVAVASLLVLAGLVVGCRDHMPHSATWVGGDVGRTHAKPAEGGYYTNWDPFAGTITLTPLRDVNPVRTQHILIATVKDKAGKPLPNRRVEWLIAEGSIGSFVEVDESGWRASRGHKVTNRYAITHTNNFAHTLTRGNSDPSDDIHLKPGDTWAVITSPVEGTSHVVAYAPGIHDWQKHKVFAEKHWYDVTWKFPPPATNPIGTTHAFTTKVTRYSDGAPLPGHHVTYKILSGPPAVFMPGGKTAATVATDANGLATITLKQAQPAEGSNDIQIDVSRPENKQCCKPAVHFATGRTRKTWVGPKIAIRKTATPRAIVGQVFDYSLIVTNPSQVAATNVVVTDPLLAGIQYVSSSPEAKVSGQMLTWALGTLPAGGKSVIGIKVKATRTGRFNNCAYVKADYGLKDDDCAPTVVGAPKLALTKKAPAEVIQCDPIPYTITVTNTGDAAATNVKIVDQLPAGMLWQGKHKMVQSDIGTLAPGESKMMQFTAKAAKTGTYTNVAKATADGGLTAQDEAKTIVRLPVLHINKTGPKVRYIGRPVTYTITVANKGDAVAKDTVLIDTIPAGTTFVRASKGGALAGGKVTWKLGNLAPNASATATITVNPTGMGQIVNTATTMAYCAKASARMVTEVKGIPAILLECVDQEDPIEVGSNETYTIIVTNQGSAVGTGIVIKCTLPAEVQFVSARGPVKETAAGRVVTFAPLKSLAPKAKATYHVVVKGQKAGDVRFKVSLTSDQMTSPAEETESTHIYSSN